MSEIIGEGAHIKVRLANRRWYYLADHYTGGLVATRAVRQAKVWRTMSEADAFAEALPSEVLINTGCSRDRDTKEMIEKGFRPVRVTGMDVVHVRRRAAP